MGPINVPVPLASPTRADLRSHLHRRLRDAAKGAPHLPHGLLIHALWDGGYTRDALSSDTEFTMQVERDVQRVKERLLIRQPGVLWDTFHVSWRFGHTYRELLKEYWRIGAILPPSTGEWSREEASAQCGMEDDERTMVHFHVREDLAEPQTLTLPAKTYMEVFILGNVLRRLVAKGIDPANTSVFLKLPNGALLRIHWYDALPIPAPPFRRVIELELHCRTWRAPVVSRTHVSTGRTILCAFYNKFSEQPRFFNLPILEGGWLELALSRGFLIDKGVEQDEDAVILRGSTLNPSCQLEAHWEDPIAVPPQYSLHALRAKSHLCEA